MTNKGVFLLSLFLCGCCIGPLYHEKEITFRACYEGTQNQGVFLLYGQSHEFMIHMTGFFSSDVYRGKYTQNVDTLYLQFRGNSRPPGVNNKVFMDNVNRQLIPFNESEKLDEQNAKNSEIDSLWFNNNPVRVFYYGKCRGLN